MVEFTCALSVNIRARKEAVFTQLFSTAIAAPVTTNEKNPLKL